MDEESIPEYRKLLYAVGSNLAKDEVSRAVFLIRGHKKISEDKLKDVQDGLRLMEIIEDSKVINHRTNTWEDLIEVLSSINRADLAEMVQKYAKSYQNKLEKGWARKDSDAIENAMFKVSSGFGISTESSACPVPGRSLHRQQEFDSPAPKSGKKGSINRGTIGRKAVRVASSSIDQDTELDSRTILPCVIQHPDWTFGRRIADGESSIVYEGKSVQKRCATTGALSTLPTQRVAGKVYRRRGATKDELTFLRQTEILEELKSHENIVKLIATLRETSPPCLVLELAPFGDLKSYVEQEAENQRTTTFERMLKFSAQVAEGMSYLETGGFIHGNLRASNVLLFDKDVVKISGFSLARHIDDDCDIDEDTMLPLRWTAIEVILYRQFKLKSDVWSFGIFLIELLTYGADPYPDMEQGKLLSELRRGFRHPKPPSCPTGVYEDILQLCWKLKPAERPTFAVLRSMIETSLLLPDYPRYSQVSNRSSAGRTEWHENASYRSVDLNPSQPSAPLRVRQRLSLMPVSSIESEYLTTYDMQSVWKTEGWEVEPSSIHLKERIGAGQFGKVYKGVLNSGLEVAVKTFTARNLSPESFLKEANFMTSLQPHPHIVELLGICTKPNTEMFIVTELMPGGDLKHYLRQDGGLNLSLAALIRYAIQICDAMSYIESLGALHRDLAARNVLVSDNGNIVKLSDFGMARFLIESEYRILGVDRIPVRWTGPEVLSSRTYTIKSDIWAFGILLVELVTYGETPYPEMHVMEVIETVKAGHRHPQPGNCPDNIYELMIKCWRSDPLARPSFRELYTILVELHAAMSTREVRHSATNDEYLLATAISAGLSFIR